MLAKVIGSGGNRDSAISALRAGLAKTCLLGVHNNKHFLHAILGNPRFVSGQATTAFLEQEFNDTHYQASEVSASSLAIAAALFYLDARSRFVYAPAGWSAAEPLQFSSRLTLEGSEFNGNATQIVKLSTKGEESTHDSEFVAQIEEHRIEFSLSIIWPYEEKPKPYGANQCYVQIGGVKYIQNFAFAKAVGSIGERLYLDDGAAHLIVNDTTYEPAVVALSAGDASVMAAMDGVIVAVNVKVGDQVAQGDVVAVLEAMKMAHQLKAGVAGVVEEMLVTVGQQLKTRQVVMVIKPLAEG
jgi:geranyl-CoA carboxylase alpha subunit